MKKILCATIATGAIVVGMAFSAQAASTADVVFLVDESGSMGGEHAWIPGMINSLDSKLIGAGVTGNQYALVGFGGPTSHAPGAYDPPHKHTLAGGDWGVASDFPANLAPPLATSGGFEDGYAAISFALSNYSYRSDAAVNYILITDEDRDVTPNLGLDFNNIKSSLQSRGILLNAVVNANLKTNTNGVALGIDSAGDWFAADGTGGYTTGAGGYASGGYGSTVADYVNLATQVGGAAWDLNQLRAGGTTAASFTDAFVDIKVGEIIIQPPGGAVPEPTTMLLFGTGLAGLAAVGRRKSKK